MNSTEKYEFGLQSHQEKWFSSIISFQVFLISYPFPFSILSSYIKTHLVNTSNNLEKFNRLFLSKLL